MGPLVVAVRLAQGPSCVAGLSPSYSPWTPTWDKGSSEASLSQPAPVSTLMCPAGLLGWSPFSEALAMVVTAHVQCCSCTCGRVLLPHSQCSRTP